MGRKRAVLFGIEAHACVQQTAFDLLELGYHTHVVVDGVSSQVEVDRAVALERLRGVGCFLTTSESLLLELLGDAKHPKFKEVSTLLKSRPEDPLHY